jgi:hypothetical protein
MSEYHSENMPVNTSSENIALRDRAAGPLTLRRDNPERDANRPEYLQLFDPEIFAHVGRALHLQPSLKDQARKRKLDFMGISASLYGSQ